MDEIDVITGKVERYEQVKRLGFVIDTRGPQPVLSQPGTGYASIQQDFDTACATAQIRWTNARRLAFGGGI